MKKVCFILAVIMVLVLGIATVGAAYTPTLPPQSQASEHSHIHAPSGTGDGIIMYGIIMPPVEI